MASSSADNAERPITTPPPVPVTMDPTPRSARSTGDGSVQTDLREKIALEMDSEMLLCGVDVFRRSYLPFMPTEENVEACVERLKEAELLRFSGADESSEGSNRLYWAGFPDVPSMINASEARVFSSLAQVADELSKHKLDIPGVSKSPRFQYRDCPNKTISSEIQGSNFKIDGCFEPVASSCDKIIASNVAVVAEYKSKRDPAKLKDNRLKVLSAANHIMNDDPRRTFTFGLTIEDNMMSLWYFSRSHSAKSAEFDFTKDYKTLISIFLCFLFADECGMGYDPTVHRIRENGSISYIYEIRNNGERRYFKADEAISSYRSLCITGRMTRVWRAVEVRGPDDLVALNGRHVALKDLWLDADACTEKTILDQIFKAVEDMRKDPSNLPPLLSSFSAVTRAKIWGDITRGDYRSYFMEIECDHEGAHSKPKPEEAEAVRGLFCPDLQDNADVRGYIVPGSNPSRSYGTPNRPSRSASGVPHRLRTYQSKKQYRLVYAEVCTALHDAPNLHTSFKTMLDVWFALVIMYLVGWVHRDISTGNILYTQLLDGSFGRGKLSDLEYAKRFGSNTSSSDPKTGTPYFMAIEVLSRELIHAEAHPEDPDDVAEIDRLFVKSKLGKQGSHAPTNNQHRLQSADGSQPRLVYNFQHDLESLWWIALWILTARINHAPSQAFASSVFVHQLNPPPERRKVFLDKVYLITELQKCLPNQLKVFIDILSDARIKLYNGYWLREQEDRVSDLDAYGSIYTTMLGMLLKGELLSLEVGDVDLVHHRPTNKAQKRHHSPSTATSSLGVETKSDKPSAPKKLRVERLLVHDPI